VLGTPLPRSLWPSLLTKLLLFPLVVLGMALLLRLPPLLRAPLVLQAAAPTAVSVLLLSEAAQADPGRPAALVLWSTLAAVVSVPLWAWLLTALGDGVTAG
jgi:predicted permease